MFLVFELEKRFKKMNIIAFGLLFIGFSYLILNLFSFTGVVVLSLLFVTLGEMFSMPFMQSATVAKATAKTRGKYLGLYGITYSIAQIASPGMGTWVVTNYSYDTLWYGIFVACCISALGFVGLRNKM